MTGEAWIIRIVTAPAEPEVTEALELVMAGASLELPIVVIFAGAGRGYLCEEPGQRWRQLADFELAELVYQADGSADFSPDIPAQAMDATRIEQLIARSRTVISL